jgi:hypothetical protein
MSAPVPIELFRNWLRFGERGISSEAIASRLSGIPIAGDLNKGWNYPHDAGDFRRCELLLRAVPEAREHLHLMAEEGPEWAALVAAWGELVELLESEVPDAFAARHRGGRTRGTYERMREILDEVRRSAR